MSLDYTTVGHVTADVMADGSRRPGGSAFYSALQAARLGRRALIITRGVGEELERLLGPYRGEFELELREAPRTTTFETRGQGPGRSQRMLAWAGEIGGQLAIDTAILHLAPIARETAGWQGTAGFLGLTPQGLVRGWAEPGSLVSPVALERSLLPGRCDAIVISEREREHCAALLLERDAARRAPCAREAVVAVTAASAPTELHLPDGSIAELEVPAVERMRDDIGAGDVFAAAFFIALADGREPLVAASFANAAAAVRVAGDGPDAVGDRAAIEARMSAVA